MRFEKLTDSFWKIQIIGWSIYFVLMFVTFLTRETTESLQYILVIKAYRTSVGFLLSCILWLIYRRIINRQSFGKNIAVIFFASVAFGIVWTMLETLFFMVTLPDYDFYGTLQYKPRVALGYAVTLMAWSAIYFGVEYWKQLKTERENALQAKILAEKAQLEMLRYQVNPHFLFNAMNSIRALIGEDNQPAKQMITQLSEFLRHSLLSDEANFLFYKVCLSANFGFRAIGKNRDLESRR